MRSTYEPAVQTASRDRIPTMMKVGPANGQFPTFVPHLAACRKRDCIAFSETPKRELTSREMEMLQLTAYGRLNKQAAFELSISIKTVEKHRQSVMSKHGIHSTAGLTHYAIYFGIVPCNPQLAVA